MDYSEADLPVSLKEAEIVTLADGTTVRWEENGGARDVMIGEEFAPRATLFEGNEYVLDAGGKTYTLTAGGDFLKVESA